MPEPKCPVCKDTGWNLWKKPMSGAIVPQLCCACELGLKMANMQHGVFQPTAVK